MADLLRKQNTSVLRLCLWLSRYAVGQWRGLLGLLATMLLKTGLDVLKPWPMKILVDNVLSGKPVPVALANFAGSFGLEPTRDNLLAWSIWGTVVLFLLGWVVGLASSYANIGFGQRMDTTWRATCSRTCSVFRYASTPASRWATPCAG